MNTRKYCPQCEEVREAAAFGPSNYSLDGLQSWCKACKRANYLKNRKPKVIRVKRSPKEKVKIEREKQHTDPALKWCGRCESWKERTRENWGSNRHYPDGLHIICRLCQNEYRRDWRRDNPDKLSEQRQLENERKAAKRPPKIPKPLVILSPDVQRHIDYFINAKAVREEKTLAGYRVVLRMFGQYIGDKWPPDSDDINGFLAAAKKRGCGDTTLFDYWRLLRNWFTWLHKRSKITENPILLTEKPASPKKLPRAPKEDDLKRLFAQLRAEVKKRGWEGARNLALITLALDTGMREGELVKLTLDDLDLEQCRIIVRETKTDRERFVVITPHACQTLTDWLKARPVHDSDRLFTSRQHRDGLTEWGAAQVLRKALKRAGAAHFGLHALRHAYAIYTLRNGGNLLDIQKQLGHTNIATTARYLLVADDDKRVERHALTSPMNGLIGGDL